MEICRETGGVRRGDPGITVRGAGGQCEFRRVRRKFPQPGDRRFWFCRN
jgi:hypothetical protein